MFVSLVKSYTNSLHFFKKNFKIIVITSFVISLINIELRNSVFFNLINELRTVVNCHYFLDPIEDNCFFKNDSDCAIITIFEIALSPMYATISASIILAIIDLIFLKKDYSFASILERSGSLFTSLFAIKIITYSIVQTFLILGYLPAVIANISLVLAPVLLILKRDNIWNSMKDSFDISMNYFFQLILSLITYFILVHILYALSIIFSSSFCSFTNTATLLLQFSNNLSLFFIYVIFYNFIREINY